MIGKLFGAATLGSTLASVGMLQRILADLATIVMLTVVSAFMLCALLAGSFTLVYLCLIHYGLDPLIAGLSLGLIACAMTSALLVFTFRFIQGKRSRFHSRIGCGGQIPDVGSLALAFIDGFLKPKP